MLTTSTGCFGWARAALLLVALAGLACGLDIFSGDPADAAFDSEFSCECGACWPPSPPIQKWGLYDLEFAGDPRLPGPSPAHVQQVRDAGGLIVYEFNVPKIRAVLRLTAVALAGAWRVRGVAAPDEYPADVVIGFASNDSTRQAALLDSVGAEVRWVSQSWPVRWRITVADSVIPDLRSHDDVLWAELDLGGRCVLGRE